MSIKYLLIYLFMYWLFCINKLCIYLPIHVLALFPLQWRHNGHHSVSHHQPHDCLLNRLFTRRSKIPLKLRITGLCAGNSSGTGLMTSSCPAETPTVCCLGSHLHQTWIRNYIYFSCEIQLVIQLTLKSIPFWGYVEVHPGPFRLGDKYDFSITMTS